MNNTRYFIGRKTPDTEDILQTREMTTEATMIFKSDDIFIKVRNLLKTRIAAIEEPISIVTVVATAAPIVPYCGISFRFRIKSIGISRILINKTFFGSLLAASIVLRVKKRQKNPNPSIKTLKIDAAGKYTGE